MTNVVRLLVALGATVALGAHGYVFVCSSLQLRRADGPGDYIFHTIPLFVASAATTISASVADSLARPSIGRGAQDDPLRGIGARQLNSLIATLVAVRDRAASGIAVGDDPLRGIGARTLNALIAELGDVLRATYDPTDIGDGDRAVRAHSRPS